MKRIVFVTFCILFSHVGYSQLSDTLTFTALNRTKLQSFLDDTFIYGGINYSGIYYSNLFRNLHYLPGVTFGAEQYLPFGRKSIISIGINAEQRSFLFRPTHQDIRIKNWFLNIPFSSSFELPALRQYDFRILLGANASVRLKSGISGNYSALLNSNPDVFLYRTSDFQRFDFGWMFGISAEHHHVILRLRSYSGFAKFDRKDQGMLSSFHFEAGYFLFRNLKK